MMRQHKCSGAINAFANGFGPPEQVIEYRGPTQAGGEMSTPRLREAVRTAVADADGQDETAWRRLRDNIAANFELYRLELASLYQLSEMEMAAVDDAVEMADWDIGRLRQIIEEQSNPSEFPTLEEERRRSLKETVASALADMVVEEARQWRSAHGRE
jgi:hypothetical protein